MDYLTELRISKAKELLCGEELSVQDVASRWGTGISNTFPDCSKSLPV